MMTDRIILAIDPSSCSGANTDPSAPMKCSSTVYHSWQELMSFTPRSSGSTLVVEIGLGPVAELKGSTAAINPTPAAAVESPIGTSPAMLTTLPGIESFVETAIQAKAGAIGSEFRQLSRRMCSFERAERFSRDLNELSARQRDVLTLIIQGQSCKEIAARLDVGLATAAKHRARIFKKLCVRNIVELVQLLNATFGWSPTQTSG